jgi:hypothetical protein
MSVSEASLVLKSARNAAVATDHTMETVHIKAGVCSAPKELVDSFSPNFLTSPGMQTTCKWQPSPAIDGMIDKMELWFSIKNSGTESIGVSNHLLLVNFLSCVVNSQEVVRYSGEEMTLIFQEYLLRQHGRTGNDERGVIRSLMELDYARFRKTSPTAVDSYPAVVISPNETENFCIPLHVIFASLFSDLFLNPQQRKAFNFQQIEFVIGFQPSTGTSKDSLFARNIDSAANAVWGPNVSFSKLQILTSYRDRLDRRISKPTLDMAILPRYEVSVKYGVDLSAANKTFQFKLSDVVNRKNVDSMYIYWRMPPTNFQNRTGYSVHTGTVANDTQVIGSMLPFGLSVRKIGSNDPAYIRGNGCSRPVTALSDMLGYVTDTFERRFGSLLPSSMESGNSDLNGWCPYLFMWDFVGLEGSPLIDFIGGTDGSQDDYVFTLTANEAISNNLELHIALRYKTAWRLSGKIPVEVNV